MNRSFLPTRLSLILLFVGLLATGCDSASTGGGDGGIIASNSSEVTFSVKPDSSLSKSFTLSYRGLSDRPQLDAESIPSPYQIESTEETGSPSDGTSSFEVTFDGPTDPGSYVTPLRFRAGSTVATIRLAGLVLGIFPLADYGPDAQDIATFNAPGAQQPNAQVQNGELVISGTDIGGPNVYPGVSTVLDSTTDFSNTPVMAARIKVASSSDGPAVLHGALNGAEGNPNANVKVSELVAEVPANGEYDTYYFDFRDNWERGYDGAPVDPSRMAEAVFLINDFNSNTFTGTIYIDEITRRQNIPEDGS